MSFGHPGGGVRDGVRTPLAAIRERADRFFSSRPKRSARGTAELSVLVVAGSLVAGALFGSGLSRTSVEIGDGLTWFSDGPSGEVIQVNPATGRPETRIDVAAPGNELDLAQYSGRLIVTNRTSGELVSFDLTSILTSGQRRVTPGAATDVLHHDDDVFLVDRERGTIAAIDPVSTDTIGEIWQSPGGISDAVVDGTGKVWSVDQEGKLSELRWAPRSGAFVTEDERSIDHSGSRSVLVGHEEGVTLFGPDQGIVVQVGTGQDDEVVAGAPRLSGELVVPDFAPASLVPVAAPQTGTVAIVSGGAVHEVDVATIGCDKPDRPEEFQGTVYVPCPGDDKVVRLDAQGARAADDIELPDGGEPSLVVDDGVLLINVPGAEHGVAVAQDGSVSTIVRLDESVPAVSGDPADVPTVDPGVVGDVANDDAGLPSTPPVPLPPVCVGTRSQCHPDEPTPDPTIAPSSPDPSGQPSPTGSPTGFPSSTHGPSGSPSHGPSGGPSGGPGSGTPGGGPGAWPSPTSPTSIPTNGPLSNPTGVTAAQLQSGEVQVSWIFDSHQPVDGFTVQEAGSPHALATISAGVRQASVTVPPGSHRFTVTALRSGSTPATSAPSAAISTADRPGAPTKLIGEVVGSETSTEATITLKWQPAAANGSTILDYTVQTKDNAGGRTLTVTGTSATYKVDCGQTYCNPGPVAVAVTARNARGTGPAVTATLTYSGPEPPPTPTAGAQLVSGDSTAWTGSGQEGVGTTTLALDPPADWASYAGTCSWTHTGNLNGQETGTFPCDATSVDVPVNNGALYDPGSTGETAHSIVFHATGGQGSADSAQYSWLTTQPTVCDGCQPQ